MNGLGRSQLQGKPSGQFLTGARVADSFRSQDEEAIQEAFGLGIFVLSFSHLSIFHSFIVIKVLAASGARMKVQKLQQKSMQCYHS